MPQSGTGVHAARDNLPPADPAWRDAYARVVRDALMESIRAGIPVVAGN